MAMTAGGTGKVKSDINVTPLVDVVLVLLIIFMVVTPMLQRGKDVVLTLSKVVDKDPYDPDGLEQRLRDEIIAQPNRPFLLKGDSRVTVGDIRKVMAIARKAGARGVRIAVEQVKIAEGKG